MEHTHSFLMDTEAILAEIDEALAAYNRSIERGLELAEEMRRLADTLDDGLADARAEVEEWW